MYLCVQPLDRDNGNPTRVLTVTATDGELSSSALLMVNLRDVNDNPPLFPSGQRVSVSVPENSPAGNGGEGEGVERVL